MTSYYGIDSGYGKIIDGTYSNYTYNSTITVTRVNGPLYYPGDYNRNLNDRVGKIFTHKSAKIYTVKRPIITFIPLSSPSLDFYNMVYSVGIALQGVVWEIDGWVAYFICGTQVGSFTANVFVSVSDKAYTSNWGLVTKDNLQNTVFHSDSKPIEYYGHGSNAYLDLVIGSWYYSATLPSNTYHVSVYSGCTASVWPTVTDNGSAMLFAPMAVYIGNTFVWYWYAYGTTIYTDLNTAYSQVANRGFFRLAGPSTVYRNIEFFSPV